MAEAIMLKKLGGVLPSTIREIRAGEFTPETDITTNYTITYDEMENNPEVVMMWTTEADGGNSVEQLKGLFWTCWVRTSIYNPNRAGGAGLIANNLAWSTMVTAAAAAGKFGFTNIPNKTTAIYTGIANGPLLAGKTYKWLVIA